MKTLLLCSALTCCALATSSAAGNAISIDIRPRACVSPCNVRLIVHVEPNEANRRITIQTESDLFGRSTSRMLDGERSAAIHEMLLTNLEPGVYDVRVSVDRAAESPNQQNSQFAVR